MSASQFNHPTPPLPEGSQKRAYWIKPPGSALAHAIAAAQIAHAGFTVVVAKDNFEAHQLEAELRVFVARELPILHFPDWETLPYDLFSPHSEIISQRISTLYRLPQIQRGILIVPVFTLMQRIAPRRFIQGTGLSIAKGQEFVIANERSKLEQVGYRHVPQVLEPGDFATRGAVFDLFPMGANEPYRIELFDQEIESIRTFDPETQRSQHKVDKVELLPAREVPLDDIATKAFRSTLRERFPIDIRRCPLYQDISAGHAPAGIEYYLPLFFPQTESLFDYLNDKTLVILSESALTAADQFWQNTSDRYEQRAHDIERPVLPPAELYLSPEQLRAELNLRPRCEIVKDGAHPNAHALGYDSAPTLTLTRKVGAFGEDLRHYLEQTKENTRVLITVDSSGRREAVLEQLSAIHLRPEVSSDWFAFVTSESRYAITVANLEDGFAFTDASITLLTERQLLGERAHQSKKRRRSARDPETIVRDLSELAIGAPVVHEDHGVGRYHGLVVLDVGGEKGEFLMLVYAKGDKLYVPVASLHLVNRYSGAAPEMAPLHTLGGEQWEKVKRRAAEKVRDVAAELLALYAQREARTGSAVALDRVLYEQFAASFPFEETPDQAQAIEAVIADLLAPKSMDRVVCGDVGFGKTEVAVRAAFVVAQAGQQVALLVPTTLLAEQHYRNFRDRFADWPIKIEVLSRFKSKKETDEALKKLASGQIDIMIGTHKLIQPDVQFKDLGLIIVDEEQRFGVRQKEQLKKLRAEVDLLTLTATPIPRTLNFAMSGLRELSIIATPPAHRLAVQTFITQWDKAQIREAMQRELSRGGQIYFLHNEVESIERMARELGEIMPEARIRFAHGQMPERELENVMIDFYRQRFNVLLSTTIIESGIDVASANTIIINRADRFGLAQLHQLRGRVGRSHHRAYCYLIVPDRKLISADAQKRLEAIESLEELGAGFALSTHDLEIRGAGELLGEEQSGQIQEVGFSLYTELLERTVRALKAGKLPEFNFKSDARTEVELNVPALIPDDYLPDVHTRLTLYKRIASCPNADALRELQVELIDRFGILPEPTKNLFASAELRIQSDELGIKKLSIDRNGGRIQFRPNPKIDPIILIKMIQLEPRTFSLDGPEKLKIKADMPGAIERIAYARELLARLRGESRKK